MRTPFLFGVIACMPTTPLPLSRRYDSVTRPVEEYLWHEFGDTMLLLPR